MLECNIGKPACFAFPKPRTLAWQAAKGAKTWEKAEDPIYALEHNLPIDCQHYLDHHLSLPLRRIFEPIMKNANELLTGAQRRSRRVVAVGNMCMCEKQISYDDLTHHPSLPCAASSSPPRFYPIFCMKIRYGNAISPPRIQGGKLVLCRQNNASPAVAPPGILGGGLHPSGHLVLCLQAAASQRASNSFETAFAPIQLTVQAWSVTVVWTCSARCPLFSCSRPSLKP